MSIRWRLALLYAAGTGALLLLVSLVAYGLHSREQYEGLDESLVTTAEHFMRNRASAETGAGPALERLESDVFVRVYGSGNGAGPSEAPDPALTPLEVLARDDGPASPALARIFPGGGIEKAAGAFATARDPATGKRVRLYALPAPDGQLNYVVTWKSLSSLDQSAGFLGTLLIGFVIGGVVAAGLGSFAVAGNSLRPVAVMTQTARAIAASRGFSRRLEETGRPDELGRLAVTFNEMLASLEEAYRSQQRFVADAAHELRAPLTAIQGNIDLLKRKSDMSADEKAEAVDYLDSEARRLSLIVSELLTLARADAGQKLERRLVELDAVLIEALTDFRPLAAAHRLELKKVEPALVAGDRGRLKQLILNLLDNSLKYTPAGGRISVGLRNGGSTATLSVRDTGVGISKADLEHVFDRFYRADKARSRDPGGSGLGLAIVSWIVDQHEGEIEVKSAPGRGTTVTVSIPLFSAASS